MLLLALLGCRNEPLLPPPGGDATVGWASIELGGVPVGAEERRRADGVLWRHRRYRFLLDGSPVEVTGTSLAELGPEGEVRSLAVLDDGGELRRWQAGAEPAWLLEVSPREGEVLALDGWTLEVARTVVRDGRWELGGLSWAVEPGLVRAGPLVIRDVSEPPLVAHVDPAALLVRPAPRVDARTARFARYSVDGQERVIRSPLPLELPQGDRARIQGLLARVPGGGDCKAQAAALVALAEASGIEARTVHGLVWLDRDGPGLHPHAWAELELSVVVPVDPALGQVIADATHLPLGPGEVLGARVTLIEAR